jgi:superfamily II DNA or RNA helicase
MSTTILQPRDYQLRAIKEIHTRWDAGVTRPAAVLPTGAGKTVVFSHLAEQFLAANPGKRVLILSHTEELGDQAAAKMRAVAPHRSVGIVRAGLNQAGAEVISASVPTLRNLKRRQAIRNVGLIIVDECHHASATTYLTILRHFGALPTPDQNPATFTPSCLTAGFTATLVRGDRKKLSDVWQDVAFRLSIAFMIRSGYLLDVKGHRVQVPDLDLRTVKQSGGDYQEGALGDALVEAMAPEIVAKSYAEHASDRKGLVFTPTVDSAYAFAEAFNAQGIVTEVLHGHTTERPMPKEQRRAILSRLRSGETQVVANCMVLTEGFDDPSISCAVIARPTKSSGLYQQMVGRVLRPDLTLKSADRGHALILDVVGASKQHGLQSLVDLSTRDDLKDKEDLSEDLTLLELEDLLLEEPEQEVAGAPEGPGWYVGPAESIEFDPLGRDSSRTWGQTPEGTYYLSAGTDGYVFLAESTTGDPGLFDVVWCAKSVARGQRYAAAAMTEHRGMDFPMATAWAEEEATARGGHGTLTLTSKKARWRKEPASAAQVHMAQRKGLFRDMRWEEIPTVVFNPESTAAPARRPVRADGSLITKGDMAEALDASSAADVIDPLVAYVKGLAK